ncbi:DUF397 domain-containing protein [Lentzea albidocapillata]
MHEHPRPAPSGSQENCVEVVLTTTRAGVRDSKRLPDLRLRSHLARSSAS